MMEKETASTTKSEPIIIEQAGMRMTVAHRQGLGGTDEGDGEGLGANRVTIVVSI